MIPYIPYAMAAYGGYKGYKGAKKSGASGLRSTTSQLLAGAYGGYTLGQAGGIAKRAGHANAASATPFCTNRRRSTLLWNKGSAREYGRSNCARP
jgi:hypothetical protein